VANSLTSSPEDSCWRSASTHWQAVDPHRSAYAVLDSTLAKDIVTRLARGDSSWRSPHDSRCLACHTNPALASDDAAAAFGISKESLTRLRSEGVSCEACHGNASNWLVPHLQWNSPVARTADHASVGFAPLFDLGQRALACAGCHVGAPAHGDTPARDMNHDMIASGHPRLNFDFAEYQRRLPPHWLEKNGDPQAKEKWPSVQNTPGVESRAWLIGTIAKAEAASRLLADRAKRSRLEIAAAPWPEFSESNCYACHHNLLPDSWRRADPSYLQGRNPGSASWQTLWPFQASIDLQRELPEWKGAASQKALNALLHTHRADASAVQSAATTLADEFRSARIALAAKNEAQSKQILLHLLKGDALSNTRPLDWDEAGQAYLAFLSYLRDGPDAARKLLESKHLTPLGESLRFVPGSSSPGLFEPRRIRDRFQQLRGELP